MILKNTPVSRPPAQWPLLPVLLLLVAAWLAFSWPWLSGKVTIPWDAKAHFQPQLSFLAKALHNKTGYAWAPFVFSGTPQIADPQSLIFSPPHVLLAKIMADPGFQAADGVSFAMLLLAGVAIILFFKDRGWHPAGALVAALAFAFGGSSAWRIQHTGQILSLCYLPITLLLIDRAIRRDSTLYGLAAGLAGGFLLLGRDQVAGLSGLVLISYVLSYLLSGEGRAARFKTSLWPLGCCIIAGLMVVTLPLLMTLAVKEHSNRVFIDYAGAAKGSLHPSSLLTGFFANIFGTNGDLKDFWGAPSPFWGPVDLYIARNMSDIYSGSLVVLALIYGLFSGALLKRGGRFFLLMLVVMLLYALGRYTPVFSLFYHAIPGVDLFRRPADGTFLVGAMVAYGAGYSVHRLASHETPLTWRAGIATFGLVLLALIAGILTAADKGRLAFATPMVLEGVIWLVVSMIIAALALTQLKRAPLAMAAALGMLLTLDLIRNNGPNESTALPPAMFDVLKSDTRDETIAFLKSKSRIEGAKLDRIELAAIDFHWPNASLVHGLHNTLGYNPLRSSLYSRATGAGDHVALADQRQFTPLFPSYVSPMANLLGLRYIATGVPIESIDKTLAPGQLRKVAQSGTTTVYENPNALPRVMFVPSFETADFKKILTTGQWPRTDFEKTVLLDRVPPGGAQGGRPGSVKILEYTSTRVLLEVDSPDGGYLVLNDPFHDWWYAHIDYSITETYLANVMFRAVSLPSGKHEVEFLFKPMRGLAGTLTDWLSGRPTAPDL